MYFKTFALGANTKKLIEKTGFRVNSFEEVRSFNGAYAENVIKTPKDYLFDGSIWQLYDISDYSERLILLCRMPIPPFNELWNLYLNGNSEDSFGSIVMIVKKYFDELITTIKLSVNVHDKSNVYRKKLIELRKSSIISNSARGKQIIAVIDSVLRD